MLQFNISIVTYINIKFNLCSWSLNHMYVMYFLVSDTIFRAYISICCAVYVDSSDKKLSIFGDDLPGKYKVKWYCAVNECQLIY